MKVLRPASPRIPPLPEAAWDPDMRALIDAANAGAVGSRPGHVFATLVRHPRLFRRFSAFGGVLLTGKLRSRERELAVLRTAALCDAAYPWAEHVRLARQAGLTDEEIARVRLGSHQRGWTTIEAAVLRGVEELHEDACIAGSTWAALSESFNAEQLIELLMLIGQYHTICFMLNSIGIQLEDE